MSTSIVPSSGAPEQLATEVAELVSASRSEATSRAYRSDCKHFAAWCSGHDVAALPATPAVIAAYLADMSPALSISTLRRRLTSVAEAHRAAGLESPTSDALVVQTWKGIRRQRGTAQRRVAPVRTSDLRSMVATLGDRLIDHRDRALLVVGFAGAFRRSELVALNVADIEHTSDGLVVHLRRSKTDQEGAGDVLGLPYGSVPATCPVRSLASWLDHAAIEDGAVFRSVDRHGRLGARLSGRAVANVVKRAANACGIDPESVSGHSLRAGLITSAAEAGAAERDIMRHSRHQSVPVMRRYIRRATVFQSNAAAVVGL